MLPRSSRHHPVPSLGIALFSTLVALAALISGSRPARAQVAWTLQTADAASNSGWHTGRASVTWDAGLPVSGVFFLRASADRWQSISKFAVVR